MIGYLKNLAIVWMLVSVLNVFCTIGAGTVIEVDIERSLVALVASGLCFQLCTFGERMVDA